MSGPKCDFFVLNEEEVGRQRREQEARLQAIQRKRQQEEQRKIRGFVYHTERVFGMERGALLEAMKPLFEK